MSSRRLRLAEAPPLINRRDDRLRPGPDSSGEPYAPTRINNADGSRSDLVDLAGVASDTVVSTRGTQFVGMVARRSASWRLPTVRRAAIAWICSGCGRVEPDSQL